MVTAMSDSELGAGVEVIAREEALSGLIRVDRRDRTVFESAFGMAHRAVGIPNSTGTQFAIASGTKGFTALVVMRLIERGDLALETTARSLLGADLPLIDDRVTVEHLLAHRSGIGDYLDEDEIDNSSDYVLAVSAHELVNTTDYLGILDDHPAKFAPGERFSYCNGGYVVLALIAERASGTAFHELVAELVWHPAGMNDTAFLRSDALPGRAALGYLDDTGLTTNVFHLPVRGNGDGGAYTTAADMYTFWQALAGGRIVSAATLAEMTRPRSETPGEGSSYGLGFWLDPAAGAISLHGFDAGVGFVSVHNPTRRVTHTVFSNQSRGAWPCSQRIDQLLAKG